MSCPLKLLAVLPRACLHNLPRRTHKMAKRVQAPTGPAWWVSGKTGHLAPWAQAVVWAAVRIDKARELWLTDDEIAAMVTKVGGKHDDHPHKASIAKWRQIFKDDPEWYPGKTLEEGDTPGPKKRLTEQKQQAIAKCAMSLKEKFLEPTVNLVRERCPDATWNPDTQAPFTDKYILEVFKTRCTDKGSKMPWRRVHPLQKTALPDFLKEKRLLWGKRLQEEPSNTAGWYARHCVWVDPCYNILSTSQRQIFDQDMAKKGNRKRWISEDQRRYSRNLRSSGHGGKQAQFGDRKLWWFVVLTRGKVHIEVMGHEWRQTGAGMAAFVERLPAVLKKMVGPDAALPRILFSDRGPGFYQGSTGHITQHYEAALRRNGFRPFAGHDASSQPPDVPDVLLHETVAAWIRNYLRVHPFSRSGSLDVQEAKLRVVLKECCQHINAQYDVDGLCHGFPERLRKLVDETKGDRLKS